MLWDKNAYCTVALSTKTWCVAVKKQTPCMIWGFHSVVDKVQSSETWNYQYLPTYLKNGSRKLLQNSHKDTTQHYIPQDSNLQIPLCHLLLSHIAKVAYSNINHTVLLCILYILPQTFQPYSPSSCTHDYSLTSLYSIPHHHTHIVNRFRYTNK